MSRRPALAAHRWKVLAVITHCFTELAHCRPPMKISPSSHSIISRRWIFIAAPTPPTRRWSIAVGAWLSCVI